jgi:hypothetical protein
VRRRLLNVLTPLALLLCVAADDRGMRRPALDRDPGWEGVRNRVPTELRRKRQDFGYVAPAGGAAGAVGGTVWRAIEPAYYGKVVGPFSFDDRLSCSGTLSLRAATATVGWQNGSSIFVGFFDHRAQGWRPVNFVGFRLEGYNEPDGATIEVGYGTSRWTAGGAFVNSAGGVQQRQVTELESSKLLRVAPDGKPHAWALRYEPTRVRESKDTGAGARGIDEGGGATVTLTFDGVESAVTIPPEHRQQGATFDRFGLFNAQIPGNEMELYLGDLTINGARENLAADPRWDGRGNRREVNDALAYGANDFGFAPAERAIGGRLWRVGTSDDASKGYYGDRVGRLTLDDRLVASGRMRVPRFCVDSGMHFGWFHSKEQGWPRKNFVGVYLDSLSSDGRFITPMYGTRAARLATGEDGKVSLAGAAHGPARPLFNPDGTAYRWRLEYDPAANGGGGAVTLWLGEQKTVLNLAAGARPEGAEFDRFGLFNMQDNNGKDCVMYLDELSYTAGGR